jgi:hypothetical protein
VVRGKAVLLLQLPVLIRLLLLLLAVLLSLLLLQAWLPCWLSFVCCASNADLIALLLLLPGLAVMRAVRTLLLLLPVLLGCGQVLLKGLLLLAVLLLHLLVLAWLVLPAVVLALVSILLVLFVKAYLACTLSLAHSALQLLALHNSVRVLLLPFLQGCCMVLSHVLLVPLGFLQPVRVNHINHICIAEFV